MTFHRRCLSFVVASLFCLIGAACSSDTSPQSLSAAALHPGDLLEPLKLPAPSAALASLREVSAQTLIVAGADFETSLPVQGVTTDGSLGVFDPDSAVQDQRGFGGSAYAVYRLNLEGFADQPLLRLLFASAGINSSNLWIGLANFQTQRWDWQRMPSVTKPQSIDLTGYSDAGGDVLVAVLMLGIQPYRLGALTVLPTDEVEPNDSFEAPQPLSSSAVSGFRGDVGGADAADFFQFTGTAANGIRGSLRFDSGAAAMHVSVLDAAGNMLKQGDSYPDQDYYSFLFTFFTPLEAADFPLQLKVEASSGVSSYDLSFGVGSVPEVPDFTYLLMASPESGPLPLTVHFSSTVVDTPEVAYYWDVDYDFKIDAVTETPELDWTFTQSGLYDVNMYMHDINGVETGMSVQIAAGDLPWDEREDNDDESQANLLDPLKADGWLGNVGASGQYDGDLDDFVSIELDPGQGAIFTLENLGDQQGELEINGANVTGLPGDPLMAFNPPILSRKAYVYQISGNAGEYKLSWVYGRPPDLTLTTDPLPGGGVAPYTLELAASAVDPDGDAVEAIKWDIDEDGVIDYTGDSISHVYETQGDKIITLYAYDEHGFRSALEYNIYVEPPMP